jgi:hypothetical protein
MEETASGHNVMRQCDNTQCYSSTMFSVHQEMSNDIPFNRPMMPAGNFRFHGAIEAVENEYTLGTEMALLKMLVNTIISRRCWEIRRRSMPFSIPNADNIIVILRLCIFERLESPSTPVEIVPANTRSNHYAIPDCPFEGISAYCSQTTVHWKRDKTGLFKNVEY